MSSANLVVSFRRAIPSKFETHASCPYPTFGAVFYLGVYVGLEPLVTGAAQPFAA